jgi:hypothetical protein
MPSPLLSSSCVCYITTVATWAIYRKQASMSQLEDLRVMAEQAVARANPATGSVRREILKAVLAAEDTEGWFSVLAAAGVVSALASEDEAVGARVNALPEGYAAWVSDGGAQLHEQGALKALEQGAAQGGGRGTRSVTAAEDRERADKAADIIRDARQAASHLYNRGAKFLHTALDALSEEDKTAAATALIADAEIKAIDLELDAGSAEEMVAKAREEAFRTFGVRITGRDRVQPVPWAAGSLRAQYDALVALQEEVSETRLRGWTSDLIRCCAPRSGAWVAGTH